MKTIIHINQHSIKKNHKEGSSLPVITAKTYKENKKGSYAEIIHEGKVVARVIYSPRKPLSCGARCWIETEEEVEVF